MAFEVRGQEDLNVADCDLVARGETPADVVKQVVDHLREEHDLDLPAPDTIIEGELHEGVMTEEVRLIVGRLRDALNVSDLGGEGVERPGPAHPPRA